MGYRQVSFGFRGDTLNTFLVIPHWLFLIFIQKSYKAKSEGVDLIEFDISLTKDGVAVILHDDTLDRTTNMSGPIRSFFHRDLIHCNPAANFMHSHSERFTYLLFTNKIYIGDEYGSLISPFKSHFNTKSLLFSALEKMALPTMDEMVYIYH